MDLVLIIKHIAKSINNTEMISISKTFLTEASA